MTTQASLCIATYPYKNARIAIPAVQDSKGEWVAIPSNPGAWRPYNVQQIRQLFPIEGVK